MTQMVKGALGGILDKVGNWADKPPEKRPGESDEAFEKRVETRRKVRYVVVDLGIIALGGAIFAMALMTGGADKLINPGMMQMGMLAGAVVVGGVGLSFLVSDLMGEKNKQTAEKIAMAVLPILLAIGGTLIFLGSGFTHASGTLQFSIAQGAQHGSFVMGVMLLGSLPFAIGAALKTYSQSSL